MQVKWSVAAVRDINDIYEFIWQHSPAAAERIFAEIEARCYQLGSFPEIGRLIEITSEASVIRRLVLGNYLIYYRIRNQEVIIQRIFDSRQDPDKLSGLNTI